MGLRLLARRPVERVWGRSDLAGTFGIPAAAPGPPIGEIWYEPPADAELLVKYLFTAEPLSIQVHPDDASARARGYPRGKDEAWYVIAAEPGATIGIGLTHQIGREALRAAALDGSIERLLDWRPAAAGDVFYSPGGTIHAIGAGLSLIEIQQNLDLTYRLYDYGRGRELHLDAGVAVSRPEPWTAPFTASEAGPHRTILAAGGAFVLERWNRPTGVEVRVPQGSMLVPIATGEVLAAEGKIRLEGPIDLLAAYPGAAVVDLDLHG